MPMPQLKKLNQFVNAQRGQEDTERLQLENDGLKAMLRALGVSDRAIEMAEGEDEIGALTALRCYNV